MHVPVFEITPLPLLSASDKNAIHNQLCFIAFGYSGITSGINMAYIQGIIKSVSAQTAQSNS